MLKELKTLDQFLRQTIYYKHSDINRGGCCLFAVALAKYLRQVGKVIFRVDGGWGKPTSLTTARKRLAENSVYAWNDQGVIFNHVFIEFHYKDRVYYVDAEGITYSDEERFHKVLGGHLTQTEAFELANSRFGWNNRFNRDEMKEIKYRMEKFFEKHLRVRAGKVVLVP